MALYKFQEHDIYLPLAVIDDLDEIKTRRDSIGWSAREVFRILDTFDESQLTKGVKVNEQGGKLFIYNTEAPLSRNDKPFVCRVNSDNAIIDSCLNLNSQYPKRKVAIITKDTGLRVRALSWKCQAENYRADLLEDSTYTGVRYVSIDNKSDYDNLWKSGEDKKISSFSEDIASQLENLAPNEYVFLKHGDSTCPTKHNKGSLTIMKDKSNGVKSSKPEYKGIKAKNIEQRFAMDLLADENMHLVCLLGPAGTGKTILTLAIGLDYIDKGIYDRIIIIKPLIPVGGKDIGALPGDKWEKLSAWLGPMRDNIEQLVQEKPSSLSKHTQAASASFEELVQEGKIEVEAMAFIQGRSIPNSIIIVDEAQNLTPREARMVVERCGKGSKVVFLGDLSQVENPFLDARSSGLAHAVNGSRNHQSCGVMTLSKVERSELAAIASLIFASPESRR
jgi:PhoH-like ATPase